MVKPVVLLLCFSCEHLRALAALELGCFVAKFFVVLSFMDVNYFNGNRPATCIQDNIICSLVYYKMNYLYSHSSHWYGCSSVLWCSTWWAAVLGSGHLSHSSSLDLLMEAIVVALGHFPRPLCTICSWVNEWVLKSQLSHLNGFSPLCLFRWYSILLHDWNTCNQ